MPEGFEILYEEGPCLVVCKPGGVLTQAPPGIDSLEVRIKKFLKERDEKPGNVYLGVPHRLDRPVSGAIVVARHARAARRISEQFEGRIVEKTYWACVEGRVAEDEGTWTDTIRKIPAMARAETVAKGHPEGRVAVLHYRVQRRDELGCWLSLALVTGRTHQIRVQAASRGHPVWGDEWYGSRIPFGPQTEDVRERWIALHARRLRFRHPMTRAPVTVTAPLTVHWRHLDIG
ncbi:MAG: RluA family pseudouridine synthase [Pirellulaceae bacterium]